MTSRGATTVWPAKLRTIFVLGPLNIKMPLLDSQGILANNLTPSLRFAAYDTTKFLCGGERRRHSGPRKLTESVWIRRCLFECRAKFFDDRLRSVHWSNDTCPIFGENFRKAKLHK